MCLWVHFSLPFCMTNSSCILQETGDIFRIKRSLFYYIMSRKCLIKMWTENLYPSSLIMFFSTFLETLRNFHLFIRVINEFFMGIVAGNIWCSPMQSYSGKKKYNGEQLLRASTRLTDCTHRFYCLVQSFHAKTLFCESLELSELFFGHFR